MGTRRSRHNKGVKPRYKDHRSVAAHLIEHPAYPAFNNGWHNTRLWWSDIEMFKLDILCESDSDIEQSADALGRSPTSIAHRARDCGLTLPSQWAKLIAPKRIYKPRESRIHLAYPYIIKARPEHADLLEVNSIIPKAIPNDMRADMCQEIMVAILEGRTSLDLLRSRSRNSAYFVRKFYHDNFEQAGGALSFSASEDENRSYDEVASSIAAKEWAHDQFAERTRYGDSLRAFTPPTQFEAAWNDQVGRYRMRAQELGQFLSHEEAEELLSETDA